MTPRIQLLLNAMEFTYMFLHIRAIVGKHPEKVLSEIYDPHSPLGLEYCL
jgi:hypothetical protein